VTERERLECEIYELGEIIKANAAALASKTISDDARELLKHQMTRRMAHQKLMQEWLGQLGEIIDRPPRWAMDAPIDPAAGARPPIAVVPAPSRL
jgi:hypothetical protein